jgi:RNA polymerase primary sigma factor
MTAKKTAPAAPAPETKKAAAAKPAVAATKSVAKATKPVAKAEPVAKGKPGRKPKVDEKAKKGEDSDVDLSDLESDLEGEPEVEAATDETKVKAKPLRMKVSRAKERALMREFGLEETALTEEEATKRRQELKTLIKMGKTRGFLTHQEINDHLPEKLVDNEILEAIVSMLNDMGIAVYEQAPDAATLLIAGGGTTTATEEEAEEAAEAAR